MTYYYFPFIVNLYIHVNDVHMSTYMSHDKYIVAVYEFEAGKVASNLVPWVEENMPPRIAERTLVNGNGYKLEKVQKGTV